MEVNLLSQMMIPLQFWNRLANEFARGRNGRAVLVNERLDRSDSCGRNNSYLHEYAATSDVTKALEHQIELAARIANRIKSVSATLCTLANI